MGQRVTPGRPWVRIPPAPVFFSFRVLNGQQLQELVGQRVPPGRSWVRIPTTPLFFAAPNFFFCCSEIFFVLKCQSEIPGCAWKIFRKFQLNFHFFLRKLSPFFFRTFDFFFANICHRVRWFWASFLTGFHGTIEVSSKIEHLLIFWAVRMSAGACEIFRK